MAPRPGPISSTVAGEMSPSASTMRNAAAFARQEMLAQLRLARSVFRLLPFDTLTLFLSGFRLIGNL